MTSLSCKDLRRIDLLREGKASWFTHWITHASLSCAGEAVAAAKKDAAVGSTSSQSSASGKLTLLPPPTACVGAAAERDWQQGGLLSFQSSWTSGIPCLGAPRLGCLTFSDSRCTAGAAAAANGAVSASSGADGVFASSAGGSGKDPEMQTGGNGGASSAAAAEVAANSGMPSLRLRAFTISASCA